MGYGDMSLLEGIEKFFQAIKEKCSSDEEYVAEILKARGFLLEDNELALSDNSHGDDKKYLNELLTEENIGEMQGDRIIIFPGANIERIFYSSHINWSESCLARDINNSEFLKYNFAPKVQLRLLERFIARYIKAISACGIGTHGSCDGNHKNKKEITIEISSNMCSLWHKIICEKLLIRACSHKRINYHYK